ncbi:unnamed protein product [Cyprideis torosa]|uniref:Phosphoenolpyruvate carboxykinase [GTP] n=1 Tax=Cyprideis torosa TaxID=163714 RepID=A0A7R8W4P5_9CRUS|nr:unnamed protein product [Cyprideis torosa]CAG0879043.1 unnamed protein product [Cyprideis torosa]
MRSKFLSYCRKIRAIPSARRLIQITSERQESTITGDQKLVKVEHDPAQVSKALAAGLPKRDTIEIDAQVYTKLNKEARAFVMRQVAHCTPDRVHVCDGSEEEANSILDLMEKDGMAERLTKYKNCWLVRTDPKDVARVEGKTFICTLNKRDAIPTPREGVKGVLGNWMCRNEFDKDYETLFRGCMKGRTLYVIPFSMGPIGGPISKIGIQITDSPYVVTCMRIMTHMGTEVLEHLGDEDFVKALHSVGQPLPMKEPPVNNWPCNPEKTVIAHIPARNEIMSFGSGYGGNSLLGKKCFALRIGSCIGRREGWLAEHMLIFGITNPAGKKHYIAAAFPSACGKTNLAMLRPSLPGYKIECVGDDIAWMKYDDEGRLRAINPETGFFGVAPGTNWETNPNAMETFQSNTVFTNVAKTEDGEFWWEGLKPPTSKVTSWLREPWEPGCGKLAAHSNSRFCAPAAQCPIIDPNWQDPKGVPIDAILFGGRRPAGVPLIYESFDWPHGVFVAASVKSEATSAAEDHGKEGKFMWPGFGDNIRALDWVMKRIDNMDVAEKRPFGLVPKEGTVPIDDLDPKPDMKALLAFDKSFWQKEVAELKKYFDDQIPEDTPDEIKHQIAALEKRIEETPSDV